MFCLSQWRLGVLCSGIVLAHLQARPMLAQLQSQTSAKPVEQSAAKASPAPSTNRGAVSAPSPASREVPDSTQYLLPGCEVVSTGKSSSNRDFSTPSSRLVGRWASREPESAAIGCHYFGPIDKQTGTGAYIKYRLEALDEKTGERTPLVPGKGDPPPKVSWDRTELRYQLIEGDSNGYSIVLGILPTNGDSTFLRETHYISCDGMSDSPQERIVQVERYIDDKNLACSDGDAGWKDNFSHFLAGLKPKPSSGAPATPGAPLQHHTSGTGKWHVSTSVSAFDDSRIVVLSLDAQNPITGWPGVTHTPTLVLRCKEKQMEAYVVTGFQGASKIGEYQRVSMRGRYDQDETLTYTMGEATNSRGFFFPSPFHEIMRMLEHSSLVLEFTPFNSNPVEMHFDLSGLGGATIKPLLDACSR